MRPFLLFLAVAIAYFQLAEVLGSTSSTVRGGVEIKLDGNPESDRTETSYHIVQNSRPSTEDIQKRLDQMPPDKRQQMLEELQKAMDGLDLINDLKSGKCTRAAEVKMKVVQGHADSVYMLSEMYRMGWCVAKDEKTFHANLEKAAQQGIRSAMFDLGQYIQSGTEGYVRNSVVARQWYEQAVKLDEARAIFVLASMLFKGEGGDKDAQRGLQLLNRAADLDEDNIEISNRALGVLTIRYLQGDEVRPDVAAARRYGLRGAAQCDPMSMALVAVTHQVDSPPNLIQAHAWATVATQRSEGKQLEFAVQTESNIKKSMNSDQIAKAESLARSMPICLPLEQRKAKKR